MGDVSSVKVKAFIELIRPLNSFMTGFAVVVALSIATRGKLFTVIPIPSIMYGFLVGFLIAASSMVFNDYFDREIDSINIPKRPIPRGDIKAEIALIYAVVLGLLGILFASLINIYCLLIAVTGLLTSITYSCWGKRLGILGNMMVSFCVILPFIFAQTLLGRVVPVLVVFMLIVFLANTGREIVKGIADVVGDLARGVRTVAVVYGEKTAARLASIFYILAVALTPIPVTLGIVNLLYIPLILIVDLGFIISAITIMRDYRRITALREKRKTLILMLLGLVAFMIGTL